MAQRFFAIQKNVAHSHVTSQLCVLHVESLNRKRQVQDLSNETKRWQMQLIERTKLCHWIFISVFLVDPSHFAAIRRDGRSVTAVCALCKKSGLFLSRWIWGVDTTNSYICQQKINFKSSPNSGWLAGWLPGKGGWLTAPSPVISSESPLS